MRGWRFGGWAFLIMMGLIGCGSQPAHPTPSLPGPTATSTKASIAARTPVPTRRSVATASPTARPTLPLPSPTPSGAAPFQPHPFPDGFSTEGNWIALEVETHTDAGSSLDRKWLRSDLWFTDGQRWLGPIPLGESERRELRDAFWRRQGEELQLCAGVKGRPVCIPAPPGIAPGTPAKPSVRVESCAEGGAICATGPDGSTRMVPLPADLRESWAVKPLCVSQGRWAIVDVFFRQKEQDVPVPSKVYQVDLETGAFEPIYQESHPDVIARIEEFQRLGVLPKWIYWAFEPYLFPEGCSPDGRFYLFKVGGGMGGSEDSLWVVRIEDHALYPLPGQDAQWVRPEGEAAR